MNSNVWLYCINIIIMSVLLLRVFGSLFKLRWAVQIYWCTIILKILLFVVCAVVFLLCVMCIYLLWIFHNLWQIQTLLYYTHGTFCWNIDKSKGMVWYQYLTGYRYSNFKLSSKGIIWQIQKLHLQIWRKMQHFQKIRNSKKNDLYVCRLYSIRKIRYIFEIGFIMLFWVWFVVLWCWEKRICVWLVVKENKNYLS